MKYKYLIFLSVSEGGSSGVEIVREKLPAGRYDFFEKILNWFDITWLGDQISKKNPYLALSFIFLLIALIIILITKFKYIKNKFKKWEEKIGYQSL